MPTDDAPADIGRIEALDRACGTAAVLGDRTYHIGCAAAVLLEAGQQISRRQLAEAEAAHKRDIGTGSGYLFGLDRSPTQQRLAGVRPAEQKNVEDTLRDYIDREAAKLRAQVSDQRLTSGRGSGRTTRQLVQAADIAKACGLDAHYYVHTAAMVGYVQGLAEHLGVGGWIQVRAAQSRAEVEQQQRGRSLDVPVVVDHACEEHWAETSGLREHADRHTEAHERAVRDAVAAEQHWSWAALEAATGTSPSDYLFYEGDFSCDRGDEAVGPVLPFDGDAASSVEAGMRAVHSWPMPELPPKPCADCRTPIPRAKLKRHEGREYCGYCHLRASQNRPL